MSKDKKDDKNEEEKPPLDLNAVGKAFVEHYYTLFDGNRMQLADLFVCLILYESGECWHGTNWVTQYCCFLIIF